MNQREPWVVVLLSAVGTEIGVLTVRAEPEATVGTLMLLDLFCGHSGLFVLYQGNPETPAGSEECLRFFRRKR